MSSIFYLAEFGYPEDMDVALYVKSAEVDAMAARLAMLKRMSKTEAVRVALEHELERSQQGSEMVEAGLAFCRKVLATMQPGGQRADKAFIDSLYDTD